MNYRFKTTCPSLSLVCCWIVPSAVTQCVAPRLLVKVSVGRFICSFLVTGGAIAVCRDFIAAGETVTVWVACFESES